MKPGTDTWIGVLGGGQLGRMLALDARRMGFKVLVWTGGDTSGAASTADLVFQETFDDQSAFERFVERVDVATVEFENVPRSLMEAVEQKVPLSPNSNAVATCQHREREKRFLADNGIPCAQFEVVDSRENLHMALKSMPGDAIAKTAEFGYDGKGQRPLSKDASAAAVAEVWADLGCSRAVLEEKVDLESELSVLVVRGKDGSIVTYDPAENLHRNHILDVSILPARQPDSIMTEARQIAVSIAEAFEYIGILGVEFFVRRGGQLLVNELAPRTHNSGHHTINACETSQFEQQVRAITGLPLGSTTLLRPAVMLNLLGDIWMDAKTPPDWSPILSTPSASLHLYGKSEARPGRKMGHANFLGETREQALENVAICREKLGLPPIQ
ncbi:MAG: 5-(carboxyamino)imidazole ribonucleotide synthase [Verrucomicrobiota bacterium]